MSATPNRPRPPRCAVSPTWPPCSRRTACSKRRSRPRHLRRSVHLWPRRRCPRSCRSRVGGVAFNSVAPAARRIPSKAPRTTTRLDLQAARTRSRWLPKPPRRRLVPRALPRPRSGRPARTGTRRCHARERLHACRMAPLARVRSMRLSEGDTLTSVRQSAPPRHARCRG